MIELRLRLSYDPASRKVACSNGAEILAVALTKPLQAGSYDLRVGLEGTGPAGQRNHFASVWVRRLAVSAPGLVAQKSESPAARLGQAQRQVAAGLAQGRDALLKLAEGPGVGRTARLATALADAQEQEADSVAALKTLLREELQDEVRPVRNLALYCVFALSPEQRRALALAYVVVCRRPRLEPFDLGRLRGVGSEIVQKNPGADRDRWGAAFLAFLAADPNEPAAPALDVGRAYTMNGDFEAGLKILSPLEAERVGSSEGRAGYSAFRLRRFREAIRLWSPPAERLKYCKLRGHYTALLAKAVELTSR